jgi:hypothetical protein
MADTGEALQLFRPSSASGTSIATAWAIQRIVVLGSYGRCRGLNDLSPAAEEKIRRRRQECGMSLP